MRKKIDKGLAVFLCLISVTVSITGCRETKESGDKVGSKIESKIQISLSKPTDGQYDSSLQEALNKAANNKTEISVPTGKYLLNENHNIPDNITLNMQKGARFVIASGKTLTITGKIQADDSYIFQGEGSVAGNIKGNGYPQWFGADEMTADHTSAFQKAVNACSVVFVPDRVNGYNLTYLELKKGVVLKGIGTNRVNLTILESPQTNYISILSSNITMENFTINCIKDERNNEMAVYFNTSKGSYENISLSNVFIMNPGYGIGDSGSKTNTVKNVVLKNVTIDSNRNTGIHLTNFSTGIKLHDVCVSSFGPDVRSKGYIFENIKEMNLENVDVLGGYTKTGGKDGDGITFINCENVSTYRLMVDYVNGRQLTIKNCKKFKISNFVTSLLKVEAIYMENFTDSTLEVIKANGCYPTESTAVTMINCSGLTINDLIIQLCGADGLSIKNSRNNTFNNLLITESKGAALIEEGNCKNTFNGLISTKNGKGISLTGESAVYGYINNSNKATAEITGKYSD